MTQASQSDVIVIGAGVAGCTTAYSLAKAGFRVALIERSQIASAASGNPAAVLYPRLSDAQSLLDQFALAGYRETLALLGNLKPDNTIFNNCGLLQLGCNTREEQRIAKVSQRQIDGFAMQTVTAAQASELAGVALTMPALYFPQAGYVYPTRFCQRLTQHTNIQVLCNTEAMQLVQRGRNWQVNTQSASMQARHIVVCNAQDVTQFAQTAYLPIKTVRGQTTIVDATQESSALRCVLSGEGYITPSIEQTHCVGATFTSDQELTIRAEDNTKNLRMVSELSSSFNALNKFADARVALRTTTNDYLPLVGAVVDAETLRKQPPKHLSPTPALPLHHGLYVNVAHGSKGFSTAALTAAMITGYLTREHTAQVDAQVALLHACQPSRYLLRELGLKQLNASLVTQANLAPL